MKILTEKLSEFPPELEEGYRILENALQLSEGFKLYIVICDSPSDRRKVMSRLWKTCRYRKAVLTDTNRSSVDQVRERVGEGKVPIMLLGVPISSYNFLAHLNLIRPIWQQTFPRSLVVWVTGEADRYLAKYAADFYRFRSARIDLLSP